MKRLLVVLALLLIAAIGGYVGWRMIQVNAEHACLASIHRGLYSLTAQEVGLPLEVDSEWRVLSDADSDRLLLLVSQVRSLDCHHRTAAGVPVDTRGARFKVAVRRSPASNNIEFLIRSND